MKGKVDESQYLRSTLFNELLLLLLFLQLQPVFSLQPAFCGFVGYIFFVVFDCGEILRDATDVVGFAFFRGMVARGQVAEGWAGGE